MERGLQRKIDIWMLTTITIQPQVEPICRIVGGSHAVGTPIRHLPGTIRDGELCPLGFDDNILDPSNGRGQGLTRTITTADNKRVRARIG